MTAIILAAITYAAASIQDLKQKQVSIIILLPLFLATTLQQNALTASATILGISIYFILRQKNFLRIGIGTADLMLAAPTIFIFPEYEWQLVLSALFTVPIIASIYFEEGKVPAIPGMTIGFTVLTLHSYLNSFLFQL